MRSAEAGSSSRCSSRPISASPTPAPAPCPRETRPGTRSGGRAGPWARSLALEGRARRCCEPRTRSARRQSGYAREWRETEQAGERSSTLSLSPSPARLAVGTEVGAAAALDDALDGRAAGRAGLPGVVVDQEAVFAPLLDVGDGLGTVLERERKA